MSDFASKVAILREGKKPEFPSNANTLEYAQSLDAQDELKHFRDEFIIPTRASLKKKALDGTMPGTQTKDNKDDEPCIYFVGNSLGAQPRAIQSYLQSHLETWASIGVNGHFSSFPNSPLPSAWQDLSAHCSTLCAPLVGAASPSEVVMMNTLTVNLHLMMASFYRPSATGRHKILLEWRPFPSDWYAFQSQIELHGLDPEESMIEIQPDANLYLSTERILAAIDDHKHDAALLLLPGIQYYTGQLFDIPRITAYAQARGLVVGWDLAHCAGNVELQLHDWNVDFAVWCTYKYLNAGPGAMAGAFVHERHGKVDMSGGKPVFKPRLSGWYGADKSVRFNMDKEFQPTAGAQGFQISNPSAIDLTSLAAALSVFDRTSMKDLRNKALVLTAYTEYLLDEIVRRQPEGEEPAFRIITPRDPLQRGTQLSLLLRDGLMDRVAMALEENGVVCDKRKPNVIRVAPVPMYCRFEDVWRFMEIFEGAIRG
ncbi:pyridoxal phosphate-dependent transferase [Sordaria brevicollis]|uniref:Kynureninase n=1 Tax=Sordaria brevicollis TaxID=83679 RepID=A0AAE0PJ73_SORBR|nr:pyridoxal phosphate-dependent transferase [Sordaria brevicollis]